MYQILLSLTVSQHPSFTKDPAGLRESLLNNMKSAPEEQTDTEVVSFTGIQSQLSLPGFMLMTSETHELLFVFARGQLVGVDVMAALDMYADRGQWEKCLDTASKQVQATPPASASVLVQIERLEI